MYVLKIYICGYCNYFLSYDLKSSHHYFIPFMIKACPEWSDWGEWLPCSETCGGGIRSRFRQCLASDDEGRSLCYGSSIEQEYCGGNVSPVMLQCCMIYKTYYHMYAFWQTCPFWSYWSPWNKCSERCGGGVRQSSRECLHGTDGEEGCIGDNLRSEVCNVEVSKLIYSLSCAC